MDNHQSSQDQLNSVYSERNKCISLLARMAISLGLQAGIGKHESPNDYEPDWLNIVLIDLPSGQVSWHIHDTELELFSFLPKYKGKWDGHTTEEKYDRVLNPGLFRSFE